MQRALLASFAAAAVAAPLASRQAQTEAPEGGDVTIVNYALTLEHLENAFYREGLQRFSAADFAPLGLGADFYDNLERVAFDEAQHVEFLTGQLEDVGATAVAECTYNFGITDAQSFLALANVLEGVGVSAYLGAAGVVEMQPILTAAGSILSVEARHSSYIRNAQSPALSPFPFPYDIPLNFQQVFTLAAGFIESCPEGPTSSLELGVTPFPAIAVAPAGVANVGDELTFTPAFTETTTVGGAWFITFPGGPVSAVIATGNQVDYQVTVPEGAQPGQAYVVLTSDNEPPTAANTVAGPAVFQIADNAVAFAAANPDFDRGTVNCDDKNGDKPGQPSNPTQPGQPGKYPTHPSEPKQPGQPGEPGKYPTHPSEPKQPGQPGEPGKYPTHPSEPKQPGQPGKYPSQPTPKSPEHKAPVYPAEPNDEDCDEEQKPKTY